MVTHDLKVQHSLVILKSAGGNPVDSCSCGRRPPTQPHLDHLLEEAYAAGERASARASRAAARAQVLREVFG